MKKKPISSPSNWRWHIDEDFVKINGELHYLWRAVDQEGTILDCYVSKRLNKKTVLKVLKTSSKSTADPMNLLQIN